MRAIITVVGKDTVGILAKVSTMCAEQGVNIIDVTQTVMQDMFVMVMMVDISKMSVDIGILRDKMDILASNANLKIHVMHEDIFNSMHKI